MRLHSLPFVALVSLAFLVPVLGACWVEPDPVATAPSPAPTAAPTQTAPVEPARMAIATGETLASEPGKGAGVFVEYQGAGQWKIWTTCDSLYSSTPCLYRLTLTPEAGARITAPGMGLDGASDNQFTSSRESELQVMLVTTSELDSFTLQLDPPGSALQLHTMLDGAEDGRVVFWVGPEVLHTGAPTNPVILAPTRP